MVQLWLDEEERALADGHSGLRITGNLSFLTAADWPAFSDYEQAITDRFAGRRIVALCSYALASCNAQQMTEIVRAHHCALDRTDLDWRAFEAKPHNREQRG